MMLQLLVVSILASFINGNQNPASFSAEELEYFATLQLCKHFGGSCNITCPFRYIRHRWEIPLCPLGKECCIGPPPGLDDGNALATNSTTSSPPTTTTVTTTTTTAPPPPPPPSFARYLQAQTQRTGPGSCGIAPAPSSGNARRKRIVGGTLAAPGSWPWLVALRSMLGSHACSGALVAQRWIVTAAHCFKHVSNPSLWRVRVGEYNLLQHDDTERDVHIDAIIMNPGYRTRRGDGNAENQTLYTRYVNDIALVHLREEARVEPICLPSNQDTDGADHGQCWVTGWGVTMDQMNEDQRLRQVSGPVIPNDRCSQMWNSPLQDSMMCFGDGTYGPCTGDSGGPLSCQGSGGRYTLEGVVSWGTEDCNLSGYPAVFTRVRPYLSWIRHHIHGTPTL